MPPKQALKRKDPPRQSGRAGTAGGGRHAAKRARVQDARTILSQSADAALDASAGTLNVDSFVRARAFEIRALQQAMSTAQKGLSTRAFQELPRALRRRTASHNIKKVPRRIRARAEREMREDNTPAANTRKKDLSTKQQIRRQVAERAASQGKKAQAQRKKLAQHQQTIKSETAAVRRAGLPDQAASSDQADLQGAKISSKDILTVTVNKGNEAPAALLPVNPPQSKKNTLKTPPRPVSLFRKRQREKTWLPTHIWHAKRAKMTLPNQPLWRFAVPLTPTERSYRATHRAATLRGCLAWDTSYMSTIRLEGAQRSLLGALRALGVPLSHLEGDRGTAWRAGSRSLTAWLRACDRSGAWITTATLIWCPSSGKPDGNKAVGDAQKRQLFVRVHPASFLQLWNQLLKVSKMQRPAVSVEDLRYDIGSIEIEGPAATEAIASVLRPIGIGEAAQDSNHLATVLSALAAITGPGALEPDVLLNLSVADPRLRHPPRPLDLSSVNSEDLLALQMNWPTNGGDSAASIFNRHACFASCRLQSSQKAINRRKGQADPGDYPTDLASDPRIPILLLATRMLCIDSDKTKRTNGSWTLLMPWHWVLPFWHSIMYAPLSVGGNPRFGGLYERRQRAYECSSPYFPADFPGTLAGQEWELREQEERRRTWQAKPKAKRISWTSLDLRNGTRGELGRGWACDWRLLLGKGLTNHHTGGLAASRSSDEAQQSLPDQAGDKKNFNGENNDDNENDEADDNYVDDEHQKNDDCNHADEHDQEVWKFQQVFRRQLLSPDFRPDPASLLTVRLSYIQQGVPATCARIYRLPARDAQLRARWIKLLDLRDEKDRGKTLESSAQQRQSRQLLHLSSNDKQQHVQKGAKGIGDAGNTDGDIFDDIDDENMLQDNASCYPPVPDAEDLIGFVSTGNFNLGEGRGTAIGALRLDCVWPSTSPSSSPSGDDEVGGDIVMTQAESDLAQSMEVQNTDGEPQSRAQHQQRKGRGNNASKDTDKKSLADISGLCIVRNAGTPYGRLARWTAAA